MACYSISGEQCMRVRGMYLEFAEGFKARHAFRVINGNIFGAAWSTHAMNND